MNRSEILREVPFRELNQEEVIQVSLRRLSRLVRLRDLHATEINPRGLRLIHRSIAETFYQCQVLGLIDKAREALNPPDLAPESLEESLLPTT